MGIHESYEVSERLHCYLCELAIPINIFREEIDGNFNLLALQMSYVIPKAEGGTDDPSNLKPVHALCNEKRSKYKWTKSKQDATRKRVFRLLNLPISELWLSITPEGMCVFDGCDKFARAGDFWQYCIRHARVMGEKTASSTCKELNCTKYSRPNTGGLCTRHARERGITLSLDVCSIDGCQKLVQRKFSKLYCQSHAKEKGLVLNSEPGVRDRASHIARHKTTASRGCYFCVEIENRVTYMDISEFDPIDKSRAVRSFSDKYAIPAKASEHYLALLNEKHDEESCRWCVLINSLKA